MIKRKRKAGKNMAAHAKMRAASRFGLTSGQVNEIVRLIKAGESRFIHRQTNTRSVHEVMIDGREIKVVYDNSRGQLRTVLPPQKEN